MVYDNTSSGGTVGTDMESGHTYTFANASDTSSAGMGNTGGGTGWVVDARCEETVGMASTHCGQHYEITGTVTETAGVSAIAKAHISEHDFDLAGGASIGTAVGVGYKAGVHGMGVHLQTQDGVSIGPQLAVSGSVSFSYKDNKITFAAAGELAAEIGIHGSFKIVIDVKPLEHDVKVVASNLVKSYSLIGNEYVETGVISQEQLREFSYDATHEYNDAKGDVKITGDFVDRQEKDVKGDVNIATHAVTHEADELGHDLGIGHL